MWSARPFTPELIVEFAQAFGTYLDGETVTQILDTLPRYYMIKEKLVCPSNKIGPVLRMLRREYQGHRLDTRDGVKVIFPNCWLLMRGSNTEPIIRLVAEAETETR